MNPMMPFPGQAPAPGPFPGGFPPAAPPVLPGMNTSGTGGFDMSAMGGLPGGGVPDFTQPPPPPNMNVGPAQDMTGFTKPSPSPSAPGGAQPPEPSEAEMQALLAQLLGGGAPGGGAPGGAPGMPGMTPPEAGSAAKAPQGGPRMVQEGNMVLEVGGGSSGGGLASMLNPANLLSPKVLAGAGVVATIVAFMFMKNRGKQAAVDGASQIAEGIERKFEQPFKEYFLDGHDNIVANVKKFFGKADEMGKFRTEVLGRIDNAIKDHQPVLEGNDKLKGLPERFKQLYAALFDNTAQDKIDELAKAAKDEGAVPFFEKVVKNPVPAQTKEVAEAVEGAADAAVNAVA